MESRDQVYQRAADIVMRKIAGEPFLIILHGGESRMFALNGMGLWFWEQLEEGRTAVELTTRMLAEYEVEPAVAAGEVDRFLADLGGKGIVVVNS